MSYGSVDAPNYRDTFTPPQQLSLSRPMVNMDAPNYRPHEPINSRPYERSFARKPQTISTQLLQTDNILSGYDLKIPWNWQYNQYKTSFKYLIPATCNLSSLKLSAKISMWDNPLGYGDVWADILINGQKVQTIQWGTNDELLKTAEPEILSWILPQNTVTIDVGKNWLFFIERNYNITLDLVATYTGDPPNITPPKPKPPFDPTMLLWGGALLGIGYIAYKYIGPRADKAAQKKGWY